MIVDSKTDAIDLQMFCYQKDVAQLRNLASALRLDLGPPSTKTGSEGPRGEGWGANTSFLFRRGWFSGPSTASSLDAHALILENCVSTNLHSFQSGLQKVLMLVKTISHRQRQAPLTCAPMALDVHTVDDDDGNRRLWKCVRKACQRKITRSGRRPLSYSIIK